ncbi:MAG: hypothetical protein KC422_08850 [Trueperaceae bacterium]|nr:hypothetical protein [Trueperaceae bacterium]
MASPKSLYPFRRHVPNSQTPNALFEHYYECASDDETVLQVWCYTDKLSYRVGETVQFYVSTTAKKYELLIAREGQRLEPVAHYNNLPGLFYKAPADCSVNGCNWPVGFELTIPGDWRSGAYIITARVLSQEGKAFDQHHIIFVRSEKPAPLLLIAATSTWLAYNDWGGSNHYQGITGPDKNQYSPIVSTQRPFSKGFVVLPKGAPRIPIRERLAAGAIPRYPHMEWSYAQGYSKKYASAGWASYERHFVRWAEAEGFDLDIASQHDLHFGQVDLSHYKAAIMVGHDEYWSWEMRDQVDQYVRLGGQVARFGGNFLWQIRFENDGQTQVCYKYRFEKDPYLHDVEKQHLTTTCWEAEPVNRPGSSTVGLNGTRGFYAGWGVAVPRGSGGFTVYRPEHWLFKDTDLYYGDVFGTEAKIFGYEVDGLDYYVQDGLPFPEKAEEAKNIDILAMGLATLAEDDHGLEGAELFMGEEDLNFVARALGVNDKAGKEKLKRAAGMIVTYHNGKGLVVSAGTCEWVAGLIHQDFFTQQITRNVLTRFLFER